MSNYLSHSRLSDDSLYLTPSGRSMMREGVIRKMITTYGDAVEGHIKDSPVRMYLKSGGNSDVYSHEGEYVIKEIPHQTAFFSLDRMDTISTLINNNKDISGFTRVPEYYGIYYHFSTGKEYLCCERIGPGFTMQDLIDRTIDISGELREMILVDYKKLQTFVETTDPNRKIFTDFHEGNVLIDFSNNSHGKAFMLVIIDQ